jgi:NADH:ubiquinone oxidoreductase subunit K
MYGPESILMLSGFLFFIGILGLLMQRSIIKTMISIEIMVFSSVLNFAYFAGNQSLRSGHFAILIAVILSGLVLSVVFTILNSQERYEISDLLDENCGN